MLILINEAEDEIDTGQFHLDAKDKRRSRIREKSLKYGPSHLPIVSVTVGLSAVGSPMVDQTQTAGECLIRLAQEYLTNPLPKGKPIQLGFVGGY